MANVLIVAYLLIVLALIAVILLQRSEGGGLGMGSNSGGLVTVRGTANLLTRTTAILATLFMATAIGLTILAEIDRPSQSILDGISDGIGTGTGTTGGGTVLDALNQLQSQSSGDLPVPPASAPAAPAGGDSGLNIPQPAAPAPAAPGN